VDVVALRVEDAAERALGDLLAREDRGRVVVARLSHHVGEPRRADGVDDVGDLLLGDRHRHRRVHVLAGVEGADHQRPVRPPLGEDRDGVHVGLEQRVERVDRPVEALAGDELVRALPEQVGDDDPVDVGVDLEEGGELSGELPGADDA
jgi:hypothetical protein